MTKRGKIKIDFIGIGAARSATTWISECLKEHPQICFSKDKEFKLFDNNNKLKKEKQILKEFRHCSKKQLKGCYPPSYFDNKKEFAKLIKKYFPEIKIIVCLRNPIDRAYSHYLLEKSRGRNISFEKAIKNMPKIVNYGMYYQNLKRFLKFFPKDKILILIYKDIQKNPIRFIQRIYRFLEIDSRFIPQIIKQKINPSIENILKIKSLEKVSPKQLNKKSIGRTLIKLLKLMGINRSIYKKIRNWNTKDANNLKIGKFKKPELPIQTRKYLYQIYKKDIKNLEKLINRKLDFWKP